MFFVKKLIFKFMELGLGLRPCFSLATRNPVFVNFRLTDEEADRVRRELPKGFSLRAIRFCASDEAPAYWVSYNLYEIKYPKPELAHVRRVRLEINTFVEDDTGRRGVFVFCRSPYVSRRTGDGIFERICDLAERLVIFIYGCGKLAPLRYELTDRALRIALEADGNRLVVDHPLTGENTAAESLSDEYQRFNDISFFNGGKTFDEVNVTSAFTTAKLHTLTGPPLAAFAANGPFFHRAPDAVHYHRGEIAYLVSAMNLRETSPVPVALREGAPA